MKFKFDKQVQMWIAETDKNTYVIVKDICTCEYVLYVNESLYSVSKTLRTAKLDAEKLR